MCSALKACTREHPRCDLPAATFETAATSAPPSRCNFCATGLPEQHIHFLAHQVVNHLARLFLARGHLAQDCGRLRCLRRFATKIHRRKVFGSKPIRPSSGAAEIRGWQIPHPINDSITNTLLAVEPARSKHKFGGHFKRRPAQEMIQRALTLG